MQKSNSLRIFAGPNGSGKSTLFDSIQKKTNLNFGCFVNADEIEKVLKSEGQLLLTQYGLNCQLKDWQNFSKTKDGKSLLNIAKSNEIAIKILFKDNKLTTESNSFSSYYAAYIAAFIRYLLLKNKKSFTFETVMSHPSKLNELKRANSKGYRTYLYFICTDDPEINVSRVANRLVKGGHRVSKKAIRSRYPKTLENLYDAIKLSRRAYLFDNSSNTPYKLIAETYNNQLMIHTDELPNWFYKYVLIKYL
ncbi:MAG: zeta toxin family protein [Chitinophagaceae bacterium]